MVEELMREARVEFRDFLVSKGFRVAWPGIECGQHWLGVTDRQVFVSLATISGPAEIWSDPLAVVLEKHEEGVLHQYRITVARHLPPAGSQRTSLFESLKELTATLPTTICSFYLQLGPDWWRALEASAMRLSTFFLD